MKSPRHTAGYVDRNRARLDALVVKNTAFSSFDALLNAAGGYFPSIRIDAFDGAMWLCDCYDSAQALRGDARRAFRTFTLAQVAGAQSALDSHPDNSPFWDSPGGQDVLVVIKKYGLTPTKTNGERAAIHAQAMRDAVES